MRDPNASGFALQWNIGLRAIHTNHGQHEQCDEPLQYELNSLYPTNKGLRHLIHQV